MTAVGVPLSGAVWAGETDDALPPPITVTIRRYRGQARRRARRAPQVIDKAGVVSWIAAYVAFALLFAGLLVASMARAPTKEPSA